MNDSTIFLVTVSLIVFFVGNFILSKSASSFVGIWTAHHNIIDLEIGRGIFCFFVFIGHSVLGYNQIVLGGNFWPPLDQYKTINHLAATGIDGFFLITGYLFANQLASFKIKNYFLINRCIRLVPTFLLATLFVVVIKYVCIDNAMDLEGFYVWIFPFFSYSDTYGDLIYGHFWSLRNEWIFYLLVFFIGSTAKNKPIFYIAFALICCIFFDITFSMILCGVIVHIVSGFSVVRRFLQFKLVIISILILFILYLYFAPHSFLPNPLRHIFRWTSTFLIGLVLVNQGLTALLHPRFVNFLIRSGTPAYSLYLVHGAVLFFLLKLSIESLNVEKYGFLLWPIFIVPIWLICGWVLYILAERPYYYFKIGGR